MFEVCQKEHKVTTNQKYVSKTSGEQNTKATLRCL